MTTTETTTRKGVIYKYTSPSGKSYIGQTIDENKRKAQHKADSLKGVSKFYSAIRKYGYDSFNYEVVYTIKGTKEAIKPTLDLKEYEYITEYDSAFKGYNSTNGNEQKHNVDFQGRTEQELIAMAFEFYLKWDTFHDVVKNNIGKIAKMEKEFKQACYFTVNEKNEFRLKSIPY